MGKTYHLTQLFKWWLNKLISKMVYCNLQTRSVPKRFITVPPRGEA
jgi:hypothetical protein